MDQLSITDQVTQRLKAQGGRMTTQRRRVLEALQDLSGHPTADEIFARAREQDPTLNLSTVYRTIRWLEEAGLVNPHRFEEERRAERFEPLTEQGETERHHHFVCRGCGSVQEFSAPNTSGLIQIYLEQFGGRVDAAELTLYGLCPACLLTSPI